MGSFCRWINTHTYTRLSVVGKDKHVATRLQLQRVWRKIVFLLHEPTLTSFNKFIARTPKVVAMSLSVIQRINFPHMLWTLPFNWSWFSTHDHHRLPLNIGYPIFSLTLDYFRYLRESPQETPCPYTHTDIYIYIMFSMRSLCLDGLWAFNSLSLWRCSCNLEFSLLFGITAATPVSIYYSLIDIQTHIYIHIYRQNMLFSFLLPCWFPNAWWL